MQHAVSVVRHRRLRGSILAALALLTAAPALARESATSAAAIQWEADWVVTPRAARELVQQGALVLDARGADLKKSQGPLANAAPVVWQDLSQPELPGKGRLLEDPKLLDGKLQALGVSKDRAVVVVGDPGKGWGEDGRVAWALRTFGHPRVVIVDGGLPALQQEGALAIVPPKLPGDFHVTPTARWLVAKEELRTRLGKPDLALLDVREPREYAGKTPYGETRGGHIPGAQGLWYKELLGKDGKLKARPEIEKLLAGKGVTRDRQVVVYCTGGIRSGWVTTVLTDLGYQVRNFAGSAWEWSGSPADQYPLTSK